MIWLLLYLVKLSECQLPFVFTIHCCASQPGEKEGRGGKEQGKRERVSVPPSPPLFPFPVKNVCMCDKAVCFSATLLLCRQQLTCLPLFFFFFLPLSFLCRFPLIPFGRRRREKKRHSYFPFWDTLLPPSLFGHCFFLCFFAFSLALFFSCSDNTAQHHKQWMGNSTAMQPLCPVEHTNRRSSRREAAARRR